MFGHRLLEHMHADRTLPLDAAQAGPPFVVTAEDVMAVEADPELKADITSTFRDTLNLDPRYNVIANVLAYHAHEHGMDYRLIPTRSWPTSSGCPPTCRWVSRRRRSRRRSRAPRGQAGAPAPALPGGPGVSAASRGRADPSCPGSRALAFFRRRRSPLPQRFDQRSHVTPVLGRQLVDAGDQELPLRVAGVPRPAGPRRRSSAARWTRRRRRGPRRPARQGPWRVRRWWPGAAAGPGSVWWRGCGRWSGAVRRAGRPRRRTSPARAAAAGSAAGAG